ncbi:MAG TPA: glycosyltransferase family 9 protein [Dehalococcoidia bacterium]|nr:glycosyltransferase family 9 protein [Dehalococcoidia bacterium]
MPLTLRQKKLVAATVSPALRLAHGTYQTLSGRRFRPRELTQFDTRPPRRILIVRLDTIGDVLLSEPAIAALRARFPAARIDVAIGRGSRAALEGNPHVDRFVEFDAPWHAAWRGQRVDRRAALAHTISALRTLRRERYDLAFELRGDFRDILFTALTGARVTVGNGWRGGGFLLDHDVPVDRDAHRVDFALGIAAAAGAVRVSDAPRLYLAEADHDFARAALAGLSAPRVVFHLGAGFPSKCLPVEKFATTAAWLRQTRGAAIVVIGGPDERPLGEDLAGRLDFPVTSLIGRASLRQTAAVIAAADLFVGNDSGPMHLVAAVGTPIVTFFGPSEPHKYRPYTDRHRLLEVPLFCRPCDHIHCVHREYLCLTRIPVPAIRQAVDDLLGPARAPATPLAFSVRARDR